MGRTKTAPNFEGMKSRLVAAEALYNLSMQADDLYKEAIKGQNSPRGEVELLVQVTLEALMAMGVTDEEIKAVAMDVWQTSYKEATA